MCSKLTKRIKTKLPYNKEKEIDVDKCMLPFLHILWDNNIQTQFHCCGHLQAAPDLIVNGINFVKLINYLDSPKKRDIIEKIEHMGDDSFQIFFNGLVVTPVRYPSWVENNLPTKQNVYIKTLRHSLGFKK
jgi:hypothetical protein